MPNRPPTKTPQEAADRLSGALRENTNALRNVKRRYRWTLASVALLTLFLSLTLKFNYDESVTRCNAGNELRSELDVKFHKLAQPLENAGVSGTPQGAELLIALEEDLTRRDCGEINWLGR